MVRSLLSVCGTALFLSGCIQSDIYYKADARGVFREIPDILPGHRTNRATYLINGRVFDYNFRAIGRGEVRDVGPGSTISQLENTSAPCISFKKHRFLVADTPFLGGLSAACIMQI